MPPVLTDSPAPDNTEGTKYELRLAGFRDEATIDDLLARARANEHGLASAISPTVGRVWVSHAGGNVYGIVRSHRCD